MNNHQKDDNLIKLFDLVSQFLTDSHEPYPRELGLNLSLQRHLGIDSIGRAELFRRIEKHFDVTMPDHVIAQAETLQDIYIFLQSAKPSSQISYQQKDITSHNKVQIAVENTHTLSEIIEMYAEKVPDQVHIYFQAEEGREEPITYGDIYFNALKVADSLRRAGLYDGETVALMLPTHPEFFYAFFGIILAGGIPVPIYPPFRLHQLDVYAKTESRILQNAEVRILITFTAAEKLSALLRPFVPSLTLVTTVPALLKKGSTTTPHHVKGHHPAFIQYTSGSTAAPKGVLLSHDNLLTNIRAYGEAIQVSETDVAVSWLPLYHDMGLIGMWLGSLYHGVPLVLMTPFSFLNHPERWLWTIHRYRGTLSGAPNFAYDLCIRKISPEQIKGLDLSSWRMAANGAEKIYPKTLKAFEEKFAPYGFKRRALLPVYGLAEATVALTIPTLDHDYRLDSVEREAFELHQQAKPAAAPDALEFVSCGKPIKGHEVRVAADDGSVLPERQVGALQFRGPSTFQGYYNQPEATQAITHDGWIDTGDLAYLADGEVYITGRSKDLIIKAGRNLYPVEIEEAASLVKGVRKGCVAAFSVQDLEQQAEQLIIVAETKATAAQQKSEIISAIRDKLVSALDVTPDKIILTVPHKVPKTSSGKLQRSACKKMYEAGRLTGRESSTYWQITKLVLKSLLRRSRNALIKLAKLIYTVYVVFMVVLVTLPILLYALLVSRDRAASAGRFWAKMVLMLAFCPVTIVGKKNLIKKQPVVYAANHASYIDSIVMMAILPSRSRIIFKKELIDSQFMRLIMQKIDYLPVNRIDFSQGIEDTKRFINVLNAGHPVMIFPEGTFGYITGLRPFKLGAFKIATETNTPVCPIALKGTRQIWRDVEYLLRPGRIIVTVSEPIMPTGNDWKDVTVLRQRVRAEIAKYCGEPALDWTIAQPIIPKKTGEEIRNKMNVDSRRKH